MKLFATIALSLAAVAGLTTLNRGAPAPVAEEVTMQEVPDWIHVDIDEVRAQRAEHGRPWQEFIRVPDLFTGLYEIPVGGEDMQSPHADDEVYYILAGRGTATVGDDRIEVGPGSVLYVAKDKDHRFVDITEDLSILVFFATAGGDGGDGGEEE
ncbi:MAG: cupin domain-containing protein [Gemmatimonadota bacterium]|nr:cupin domain-containing protein [Gemmatimonadota bacterium]